MSTTQHHGLAIGTVAARHAPFLRLVFGLLAGATDLGLLASLEMTAAAGVAAGAGLREIADAGRRPGRRTGADRTRLEPLGDQRPIRTMSGTLSEPQHRPNEQRLATASEQAASGRHHADRRNVERVFF